MAIDKRLYKYHVANLREIETAINHISRLARYSISRQDPEGSLRSLVRLYAFLLGGWAETRLCKLIYEKFGFSEDQRQAILAKDTQLERWNLAVEVAFRKHYKIPKANLNRSVLGVASFSRYETLCVLFNEDIKITIEIRNKLAHGQWLYPLNNEGTSVETEKYRLISLENVCL